MDFNLPEELKMVQTLARDFVKEQLVPLEKEILGRESDLEGSKRKLTSEKEAELTALAKQAGLWGVSIPESFGGSGLGILGTCLVEEELAKTIVPFNPGDVTPVLFDCNEEQKKDYLVPLLEGRKSFYFALLEPGKGLDPSKLEMKAERTNRHFVLNGKKIVFSKNCQTDFSAVFAITDIQKGLRDGVTCFLVDNNTAGVTISKTKEKTSWQAQVAEPITVNFENCRISIDKVLGEEGQAFYLGQKWLAPRRIVRGARCLGAAERLLEKAIEHANSWTSFGQPVATWSNIRELLADIAIDIEAARLVVYAGACRADEGQDIRRESAMVKVFTSEMLRRTADKTVLIKNGPGPLQGLPLDYLCRNLLAQNIAGRALEVQKGAIVSEILKLGKAFKG